LNLDVITRLASQSFHTLCRWTRAAIACFASSFIESKLGAGARPRQLRRSALAAFNEMTVFALLLGDRQETALLVLAALVLFCLLPLVIVGFILYRVVVGHSRNGSDDAITLDLDRPTTRVC
jgi:hypothetical protein